MAKASGRELRRGGIAQRHENAVVIAEALSRLRERHGVRSLQEIGGAQKDDPSFVGRGQKDPAMTYFRTFRHYHRLQQLNGRVRDGNECFLQDVVTGNRRAAVKDRTTRLYTTGESKRVILPRSEIN